MFDLETLKDQTVRMIEVLEKGEELDGPQGIAALFQRPTKGRPSLRGLCRRRGEDRGRGPSPAGWLRPKRLGDISALEGQEDSLSSTDGEPEPWFVETVVGHHALVVLCGIRLAEVVTILPNNPRRAISR